MTASSLSLTFREGIPPPRSDHSPVETMPCSLESSSNFFSSKRVQRSLETRGAMFPSPVICVRMGLQETGGTKARGRRGEATESQPELLLPFRTEHRLRRLTAPEAPATKAWKALSVAPARTLRKRRRKVRRSEQNERRRVKWETNSLEARVLMSDSSHLPNVVIRSLISDDAVG
jgi:hypothetical protein